ncbi:hypothetical protein EV426DRAFT_506154, partial [Tirmania nivea]
HIRVHSSLLAPWYSNPDHIFPSRSLPKPGPAEHDALGPRYVFERIVKHSTKKNGKTRYFVKWEGWGDEDNTWEPAENI